MPSYRPPRSEPLLSPSIPATAFTLVIGSQKSATTSLFANLEKHPEVCRSVVKEPEYFSEHQTYGVDKTQYARYESLWPEFDESVHRCCLEASTGYTKYPHEQDVAKRIKAYGLKPRFIYLVRNPFDRIESHLNFDRIRFGSTNDDFTDPYLIELSRYALQLDQFLMHFPDREQYRVITFDDLVGRPHDTLRKLFTFMEIDPNFSVPLESKNRTRPCSVLEYKLRPLGLRNLARTLLPDAVRRTLRSTIRTVSPSAKLKMSRSDRDLIHEALWDDMQRLRKEFGVPVEIWGF